MKGGGVEIIFLTFCINDYFVLLQSPYAQLWEFANFSPAYDTFTG